MRGHLDLRNIFKFILAVTLLVVVHSLLFMVLMNYEGQTENVDFVTAVYWVVITACTVGYGEIVFHSPIGRIFSILVSISGIIFFFAVAMPIAITPWFERLTKEPPSSALPKMSDHIIICGYNSIVETLTERLSMLGMPFLVIERSEAVARSIYKKYPTIWGSPSETDVLINANIRSARLLIANETDESNADIVLTVRRISDIEVIALVNDLSKSRFLTYAKASRIISPKTLLGTFIAQITSPPKPGIFPGAVQLSGGVSLVVLPIYPKSVLIGKTLVEVNLRKETGANIVGIWRKGTFVPCPDPGETIHSNSVLMAVGDIDQLSQLRDFTKGVPKNGATIVAGYGDVGRRVVRVLFEEGVQPVVVDRRDLGDVGFRHIMGDATSEEILMTAGVKDAVVILLMLNNDTDVVFSTLMARNLNPDAFIVARANHVGSAEKIYRAGADYVASVPIVASHMLAKIAQSQEEELAMIYESLEVKMFHAKKRSALAGKSLRKLCLPERFGCTVVVIIRAGDVITAIDPDTVIEIDDIVAILGSISGIVMFSSFYEGRFGIKQRLFVRSCSRRRE
ncbi:MAG: potassium channel family protein [Methanotrichaceae archaeon]